MIVGNDIHKDARVKKTALSVARLGYRVTVVGRSVTGRREESSMAGVRLVLIPVPWRSAVDAGRALNQASRWWRSEKAARAAAAACQEAGQRVRVWSGSLRRRGPLASTAAVVGEGVARASIAGGRNAARIHRGMWRRAERRIPVIRRGRWWWHVPEARDYARQMSAEVAALAPDVIHAHDVNMMKVADDASALLRREGRNVPWVYDAHEYVPGLALYGGRNEAWREGWARLERRLIRRAARVLTVSPVLVERLRTEHRLAAPPLLTMNVPWAATAPTAVGGGVRAEIGLAREVPLLVFSGGITSARGVESTVRALVELPRVHLVIVPTPPRGRYVEEILDLVDELGVADRVHVAAPVAPEHVVANLASADLGLVPFLRYPNHDVALPNKLFEYLHAGLPVVVSDCPTMADFVQTAGIGTVHRAGDPAAVAVAVRQALSRLDELRVAVRDSRLIESWSWQHSEAVLEELYRSLIGPGPRSPAGEDPVFPSLSEESLIVATPAQVVALGVPEAVVDALAEQGLATEDPADEHALLLVGVDERLTSHGDEVAEAATAGRPVVAFVSTSAISQTWQETSALPRSERLRIVSLRAWLRDFPGLLLTTDPLLVAMIPGAELVDGAASVRDRIAALLTPTA